MKLHKEGKTTLRNQFIIYIIIGIITQFNYNFYYYITPVFLITFLFFLYFFRKPNRKFEREKNSIYAPCDGKVVVIEKTIETEFYNDKRIQVSIFMSPLNIHNNLYPISGTVTYTKYHPGKSIMAWKPKASTDNERSTIVVENNKISILCRQIAGALARRIITYSKVNDIVNVADEIGFIKFGSRVDLFLPIDTKINVSLGEKVIGGQSIIAQY
tara:strand:+ start:537 stop:1178 length:642 start_codon:yes stop_codon:yes gene_type:complete